MIIQPALPWWETLEILDSYSRAAPTASATGFWPRGAERVLCEDQARWSTMHGIAAKLQGVRYQAIRRSDKGSTIELELAPASVAPSALYGPR